MKRTSILNATEERLLLILCQLQAELAARWVDGADREIAEAMAASNQLIAFLLGHNANGKVGRNAPAKGIHLTLPKQGAEVTVASSGPNSARPLAGAGSLLWLLYRILSTQGCSSE